MSDQQKPWEDQWGFEQWVEWQLGTEHQFYRTVSQKYLCRLCVCVSKSEAIADTLDEAARECTRAYCKCRSLPLPWRERPDISSVESCIRAITDAGGGITIYRDRFPDAPVLAWAIPEARPVCFGKPGEPWSLESLQAAARYVLGIDAEEAKQDETRE
jgi:hypothetical protein